MGVHAGDGGHRLGGRADDRRHHPPGPARSPGRWCRSGSRGSSAGASRRIAAMNHPVDAAAAHPRPARRRRPDQASSPRTSRSRRCRPTSRAAPATTCTCGSRSAAWPRSSSPARIAQRARHLAGGRRHRRAEGPPRVTRQWVSVPKECEPNVGKLDGDGIRVLKTGRHTQQAQARPPPRQPLPHPDPRRRPTERRTLDAILDRIRDAGAAELLRPAAVRPRRQHGRPRLAVPRRQGPAADPAVPVPVRALGGAVAAVQRLPRPPDDATACSARCSPAT